MTDSWSQEREPQTESQTSEADIMKQSMDIIMNWKPVSDVFALKYFTTASGLLSGCSAAYINAYYRKVFKLQRHAFLTCLFPVVIAPAVVGGLMHHYFVQRPMLLNTFKCPVCVEVRAGMVQLFAGFVYPLLLAPTAAMQFAVRLYTYPVPDARNPLNVVREVFKITKPILPKFYLLAGLQVVGGVAWTHWELHNLFTVSAKTGEMEEAIKEHRNSKLNPV